MKVYHTYEGQYLMHGREFPKGTVVLQLDNGVEMYCSNFKTKSRILLVLLYDPRKEKWFCGKMKNDYTELMWKYFIKHKKEIIPERIIFNKNKRRSDNKQGKRPTVPKSVRWAAEHPFQGGGVSPR